MKIIFILICFTLLSNSFGTSTEKYSSFSIVFGGCFEKDRISLKVNESEIFTNYEVISDKMFRGISNLTVNQIHNKLIITHNGKDIYMPFIRLFKKIKIDILVNDIHYQYEAELKHGNTFIFGFCNSQNLRDRKLTFEQKSISISTPIF